MTLAELGLADTQHSQLGREHAQIVAATLDADRSDDERLPLLWHWAYFNPIVPSAQLGDDGHPIRHGALLAEYPRRMWVGGEVHATDALRLDTPAVRRTRLIGHERKHGSTGALLLVALEHTIEQHGAVVLSERQDVIYRAAGGTTPAPGPPIDMPAAEAVDMPVAEAADESHWVETMTLSRSLLFRFSAITFNGHRIHYDRAYAVTQEGYPDVVVHGPLTATLLAGAAVRRLGRPLSSFSFRASSPLFPDAPVTISATVADEVTSLTARRHDGVTAMTATAR